MPCNSSHACFSALSFLHTLKPAPRSQITRRHIQCPRVIMTSGIRGPSTTALATMLLHSHALLLSYATQSAAAAKHQAGTAAKEQPRTWPSPKPSMDGSIPVKRLKKRVIHYLLLYFSGNVEELLKLPEKALKQFQDKKTAALNAISDAAVREDIRQWLDDHIHPSASDIRDIVEHKRWTIAHVGLKAIGLACDIILEVNKAKGSSRNIHLWRELRGVQVELEDIILYAAVTNLAAQTNDVKRAVGKPWKEEGFLLYIALWRAVSLLPKDEADDWEAKVDTYMPAFLGLLIDAVRPDTPVPAMMKYLRVACKNLEVKAAQLAAVCDALEAQLTMLSASGTILMYEAMIGDLKPQESQQLVFAYDRVLQQIGDVEATAPGHAQLANLRSRAAEERAAHSKYCADLERQSGPGEQDHVPLQPGLITIGPIAPELLLQGLNSGAVLPKEPQITKDGNVISRFDEFNSGAGASGSSRFVGSGVVTGGSREASGAAAGGAGITINRQQGWVDSSGRGGGAQGAAPTGHVSDGAGGAGGAAGSRDVGRGSSDQVPITTGAGRGAGSSRAGDAAAAAGVPQGNLQVQRKRKWTETGGRVGGAAGGAPSGHVPGLVGAAPVAAGSGAVRDAAGVAPSSSDFIPIGCVVGKESSGSEASGGSSGRADIHGGLRGPGKGAVAGADEDDTEMVQDDE